MSDKLLSKASVEELQQEIKIREQEEMVLVKAKKDKPKSPTHPKLPKNPNKYLDQYNAGFLESSSGGWSFLQLLEHFQKMDVEPGLVELYIGDNGDSCYECGSSGRSPTLYLRVRNVHFEEEMRIYEKEVVKYNKDCDVYNDKMKVYRKELKEWKKKWGIR